MTKGFDSAHPHIGTDYSKQDRPLTKVHSGLTKREYFAAMAMQGLCAGRSEFEDPEVSAQTAVRITDKLIEELNK